MERNGIRKEREGNAVERGGIQRHGKDWNEREEMEQGGLE